MQIQSLTVYTCTKCGFTGDNPEIVQQCEENHLIPISVEEINNYDLCCRIPARLKVKFSDDCWALYAPLRTDHEIHGLTISSHEQHNATCELTKWETIKNKIKLFLPFRIIARQGYWTAIKNDKEVKTDD